MDTHGVSVCEVHLSLNSEEGYRPVRNIESGYHVEALRLAEEGKEVQILIERRKPTGRSGVTKGGRCHFTPLRGARRPRGRSFSVVSN